MPQNTDEYEVLVPHTWEDPKTGKATRFKAGDTYTGGDVAACLAGVDFNGPLIRKKTRQAASPAESIQET